LASSTNTSSPPVHPLIFLAFCPSASGRGCLRQPALIQTTCEVLKITTPHISSTKMGERIPPLWRGHCEICFVAFASEAIFLF
jgi:hypothetical protein